MHAINLMFRNIENISAGQEFFLQEESRQAIILLGKTYGFTKFPLAFQDGHSQLGQIIFIQRSPEVVFNRVVLPAPLGPIRPSNSP